jgi:hypothetical protein
MEGRQIVNIIWRAYRKHGFKLFIELMFHPVLVPLFSLWSWIRTLLASRVLLYGQWSRYSGFSPRNSLNSFFYKTQWLNINRYGRRGRSPVVGLGDHPLSRWFHLTLWSSFVYANAGAVTILCGTIAWAIGHLVWASVTPWYWVVLICGTVLFSSTGFAMAFVLQNYNILGWMWLPIVFYGALADNLPLATLALLAGSFASITMVVSTSSLLFVLAVVTARFELLLVLIPAAIKLSTHLLPMLLDGGVKDGLINVAKVLGFTDKEVRYKRTNRRFGFANSYFTVLYGIGCLLLWLSMKYFPILPVSALGLFIINQRFMRFMDEQSCYILFLSSFAATVVLSSGSWYGYSAFVLVSNPFPLYLNISSLKKVKSLVRLPSLKPFNHSSLINALEEFLSPVPPQNRILMTFDNPGDNYWAIFDGYRILLEPALYVAAKKEIHLFPDWYSVTETNYQGSPALWGREREYVLQNMVQWKARYALVYEDSGSTLDPVLQQYFDLLATFDWNEWVPFLRNETPWPTDGVPPTWYLLKKKEESSPALLIDDRENT